MWCLGGLGLAGIGGEAMTSTENNETKVTVLSKNTYTAKKEYDCILCHKPIAVKSHYVRVLVKPDDGVVQTQRWCLPCWLG
jgi:hypothetical protein